MWRKFILKAACVCTWLYRVLLCGFVFIYSLNFIVITFTSCHWGGGWAIIVHQCCCMDHMAHSGSSDHESMSWPLEGEHTEARWSNGNQYEWWINRMGTGNKSRSLGRPASRWKRKNCTSRLGVSYTMGQNEKRNRSHIVNGLWEVFRVNSLLPCQL